MAAPIIGVTTFHTENQDKGLEYISVTGAYVRALIQAGGVPVLLPLGLPQGSVVDLLRWLDGILFTGGGDIGPDRYGAPSHPLVENVDPERDDMEIHLARLAAEEGVPFLGICRGLQTVNVALGGTLYTDILAQHPAARKHACFADAPRTELAHSVHVEAGSRLAGIIGAGEVWVNSGHHQAVHALAPGVAVSARAPDGIVEGVELPGHRFGLAVQWHPEWLQEIGSMRDLFRALVVAAAGEGSLAHRSAGERYHVAGDGPHRRF